MSVEKDRPLICVEIHQERQPETFKFFEDLGYDMIERGMSKNFVYRAR